MINGVIEIYKCNKMFRRALYFFGFKEKTSSCNDDTKPTESSDKNSDRQQKTDSHHKSYKSSKLAKVKTRAEKNITQINQYTDDADEQKSKFVDEQKRKRVDENYQALIFDIGKPCNGCMLKSLKEIEVRCTDCFSFECLHCNKICKCSGGCFCYKFQDMFEKQIENAFNELTEYLKHRAPIKAITHNCTYEIHESKKTKINSSIKIKQEYKSDESMQTEKQNLMQQDLLNVNHMKIVIEEFKDNDHVDSQTVYVLLEISQVVGIYSKDGIEKEIGFIANLKKILNRQRMQLVNIKQPLQALEEDEMPIIVTCPLHSRLYSDICHVMSGIKEEYYKRIILILIHYRKEDRDASAFCVDYENKFPALKCVDFFHQTRLQNTESVATEIKLALNEMRNQSKHMNN